MKTYWSRVVLTVIFALIGGITCNLWGQENAEQSSVLHIVQSKTISHGSHNGFATFNAIYKVLDGVKSPAEALALNGTLSLKNYTPTFSEVLFLLIYYQGACPANNDLSENGGTFIWSEILKNPSLSDSHFDVNLSFPKPLPMTGCIGLLYGGGPLLEGKATMSADLELTYRPGSTPNTVIGIGGEYCFGQNGGCQNATAIDGEAFAVPTTMLQAGHLLELYGNISDSTFDGTKDNGPLPTGTAWGGINDFYLLPGGCGVFEENLNSQGFSNPAPLSTLHSWLPHDALHLASVPVVDRVSPGISSKAALQNQVENIFSVPIKVNAGDCMLVIYGRTGNGATDNETQVNALMAP
jgi:hypothetical protein